ncbi:hypothetical protein [Calothrix sp. NIES-3974]|uniref:hypothetical protein n=1 Tax=Calothrix sp. NIES-3974 TaxID=2005462 RepID=UPI000B5F1CCB|nr:hypothetical protein [Calothrix sp. NIES-3974]BAZ04209.1 hypothetical protein NIES3974_08410 [Calothrix sp. NIES-3974]
MISNNHHRQHTPFISKTCSQFSIFLIILANITPAIAAPKYQSPSLNQPVVVSGLFGNLFKDIEQGTRTIERIERQRDAARRREEQRKLQEQRREEQRRRFELQQREREQRLLERQAREEERQQRKQELAEARRRATQRQLEEAERRRRYFENLSPAQKQEYIRQQQLLRQRQLAATIFLLDLFLRSDSGSTSSRQTREYYRLPGNSNPSHNPAPAPVKPIHNNYGSCHHYSC